MWFGATPLRVSVYAQAASTYVSYTWQKPAQRPVVKRWWFVCGWKHFGLSLKNGSIIRKIWSRHGIHRKLKSPWHCTTWYQCEKEESKVELFGRNIESRHRRCPSAWRKIQAVTLIKPYIHTRLIQSGIKTDGLSENRAKLLNHILCFAAATGVRFIIGELAQPQIPSRTCSVIFRSLGGTFPDRTPPLPLHWPV